jgi:hypothetical protein
MMLVRQEKDQRSKGQRMRLPDRAMKAAVTDIPAPAVRKLLNMDYLY